MTDFISEADLALLGAYLDQELTTEEKTALQQRLLQEPLLRAKLDELQHLDTDLKQLLQKSAQPAVPDKIKILLGEKPQSSTAYRWPLAIAASLLLVVANLWLLQPQNNPQDWQQLAQLLDNTASFQKQQIGQQVFMPVRSFQHKQGQYCREYYLQTTDEQEHAIACKQQGIWQKQVGYSHARQTNYYQTATGQAENPVSRYFNRHNINGALTAISEEQKLRQGW